MEKEHQGGLQSDSQNFISSLDSLLDVDSLPNLENLSRDSPPALLRNMSQTGAEMEIDINSLSETSIRDISVLSESAIDGNDSGLPDTVLDSLSEVSETDNDGILMVPETVINNSDFVKNEFGFSEAMIDGISAVSETGNDGISLISEIAVDDNDLVKDDNDLTETLIDSDLEKGDNDVLASETFNDSISAESQIGMGIISPVSDTVMDSSDLEKEDGDVPGAETINDMSAESEMVTNIASPVSDMIYGGNDLVIDEQDFSDTDINESSAVSEMVSDRIALVSETVSDGLNDDCGLPVAVSENIVDSYSDISEADNDDHNFERDNDFQISEAITDGNGLEKDDLGFEFFEEEIFHPAKKISDRLVKVGEDMYTISEIGSEEDSMSGGQGSEVLDQSESEAKSTINKNEVKSICEKSAFNEEEGKGGSGNFCVDKDEGKNIDSTVEKHIITKKALNSEQTRNFFASCIKMIEESQKAACSKKEHETKARTPQEKPVGQCEHKVVESAMKDNKLEAGGSKQKQKVDVNAIKAQLAKTMNVANTQLTRTMNKVKNQLENKERETTVLTASTSPSKTLYQLRKEAREARNQRTKEAEARKKRSASLIKTETNKQTVEKTGPHLAKIDGQKLKEIKEKRARKLDESKSKQKCSIVGNKTKETVHEKQTSDDLGKLNIEQVKLLSGKNSLCTDKKKEKTEMFGSLSLQGKMDQKKRKAAFEVNENTIANASKMAKIRKVDNAKSEIPIQRIKNIPEKQSKDLQGQVGEGNKTKPALSATGLGRLLIENKLTKECAEQLSICKVSTKENSLEVEKSKNKLKESASICKIGTMETIIQKSKNANAAISNEKVPALKTPAEGTSSAGGGSTSMNAKRSESNHAVAGDDLEMVSDDDYDEEIEDSEVSAWLDAGLEKAKEPGKPEQIFMEKVILNEKGENMCEMLPEGWVKISHFSGMPLYLHKQSRVCCMSRPYFVGSCAVRKHHVPLSAIPCLHYKRELDKEKKAGEAEQNKKVQGDATKGKGGNQGSQGGDAKVAMGNGDAAGGVEKKDDGKGLLEDMSKSVVEAESVPTLDHETLREYCSKQFIFQTVRLKKFNSWKEKRSHFTEERRKRQETTVPTLSKDMKLITTRAFNTKDKPNQKKEYVLNPVGKTPACILHELTQQVLKVQPTYQYKEIENSETPYKATVVIEGIQYGSGVASGKKQAKAEAAKATLEIFLPNIVGQWKDDPKSKMKYTQNTDKDMLFFEEIAIEDPRVADLCEKAALPRPYEVLQECLKRNFGMGDTNIHVNQKMLSNQKSEFSITVGKHSATVLCKNKREGRQRAAQAVLQLLHPKLKNWASILRLYSNCNTTSYKEMEEEGGEDGENNMSSTEKNFEILKKLKESMKKVKRQKEAMETGNMNDATLIAQPLDL